MPDGILAEYVLKICRIVTPERPKISLHHIVDLVIFMHMRHIITGSNICSIHSGRG